jgi:hypothetical protein
MTSNLSRRSALAALGSAAAVPALAAPTVTASADEKLFALERKLLAAKSRWVDAFDRVEAAQTEYFALRPKMPERKPPEEYFDLYQTITVGQLGILPDDHPLKVWGREINDEHEARLAVYRTEEERVRADTGIDIIEDEAADRLDEGWNIAREIWRTPAATPAGLMVKIRATELLDPDDVGEAYFWIAADIRAMAMQS